MTQIKPTLGRIKSSDRRFPRQNRGISDRICAMKQLNGSELASYIKTRQAKAVRGLRQADHVEPKLAVIVTIDNPVIETYMRLKKQYGHDILVDVDIHRVTMDDLEKEIARLNQDDLVHGIILQLPLEDPSQTQHFVDLVAPHKDVDGLGKDAKLEPATPTAILWLLAGYGVELWGKRILVVGHGKLVGEPLAKMLRDSEFNVTVADRSTKDLKGQCLQADVIVTATGSPGIITADMVKPSAVVVDAGVASEEGKTVGDLAPDMYLRDDLTITPQRGGVGPLTVCALFENVIKAARSTTQA